MKDAHRGLSSALGKGFAPGLSLGGSCVQLCLGALATGLGLGLPPAGPLLLLLGLARCALRIGAAEVPASGF